MKKLALFMCMFGSIFNSRLCAMEQDNLASTRLVVIPGQNGLGGDCVKSLFPQFDDHQIIYAGTPGMLPDLGQSNCIRHFAQTMQQYQQDDNVKNIIIHASSQGTGTASNYASRYPDKIKMIFCEGMMPSGNSAISWTTKEMVSSVIARVPGSYYLLPYIAKAIMPLYAPAGEQAIFNVHKLRDIPMVIIHSPQDPQLSYIDAQAFYGGLPLPAHSNNKYFVSVDSGWQEHVNLIEEADSKNGRVIHKVLEAHGLPAYTNIMDVCTAIDLNEYQPEPNPELYNNLLEAEKPFKVINWGIRACVVGMLSFLGSKIYGLMLVR